MNELLEFLITESSKHTVKVNNKMQKNYQYELVQKEGDLSDLETQYGFKPELTPKQMLELGVFEGKYLNDCLSEYPKAWFVNAKLSKVANPELNFFKSKSRRPLSEWEKNGWIIGKDPRGWFEWYCRTYRGRRDPEVDAKQCARWKSFIRHKGQIVANCDTHDMSCRPTQRQALLQWAYDSRNY